MFIDRDKLQYYIQICKAGASFARTKEARIAYQEALAELRKYE